MPCLWGQGMKPSGWLVLLLLSAGATGAHGQESAERWFRAGTWMLRADVGGAAFTDFQRGTATAAETDPDLGTFQRRVSARTTATTGGSISYWILDGWGVRAGMSYSPSGFAVWNEARAQRLLDERMQGERPAYAGLSVWYADAAVLFRLPFTFQRVVPYGLAGGGLVEYRPARDEELPPEARDRFAHGRWRAPAALFGIGAVAALQYHNLMLNAELSNHLVRTPLDDAGRGEWFELGGVPVQLLHDPRRGGDGIGTTSNLRLTVGITLPLR
jgi:hypothetical protein